MKNNKYYPMLFSTPMVEALLAGTKTMTRRTKELEFYNQRPNDFQVYQDEGRGTKEFCKFEEIRKQKPTGNYSFTISKYKIGDIFWVRETFSSAPLTDKTKHFYPELSEFIYKADYKWICVKWKPSLFMPKAACRLFLEITDIKCERINDISEEDAINEGVLDFFKNKDIAGNAYFNYLDKKGGWDSVADSAIHSFETLWIKINGADSWENNPWVWVYTFKIVPKPSDFLNVNLKEKK